MKHRYQYIFNVFFLVLPSLSLLGSESISIELAETNLKGATDTISKSAVRRDRLDSLPNSAEEIKLIYSNRPKTLALASTAAVYTSQIQKSNVTSVRNALTGRLTGLRTIQSSGQPGADGVTAYLRGLEPLVIIDGIPRNLTILDLEEIESVTVLKDALATATLGVRGSNGALLITTRKGSQNRQQISFTAQSGVQKPLKMPQALNAFDYASLYNEALQNDGLIPAYSATALDAFRTGSDPVAYPNVDWRNQVLKDNSRFDRYTLNVTGGSSTARYFVSLEHFNQTGFFATSDQNKYNTNNDLKSYLIRSNVDVDIDKNTTVGIHLFGRILNGNEPGAGANTILNSLLNTPNGAYPVYNPDGSFGGTSQYQNNIFAQTINSGYLMNYKRDMMADLSLKRKLDGILEGLWIKGTGSFYASLSENTNRNKSFAVFQRTATTPAATYTQYGTFGDQANSTGIAYQNRQDYLELALGYDKRVDQHGFQAILLGNRDNSVNGADLPLTYTGLSGRLSYDFDKRYLAEVAFGYNGSNRYPEGTKYGFFPAVGLGWNVSEESFLKNSALISRLKLSASYGLTGWDDPGYFTYKQYYFDGPSYTFGTSGAGNTSINELILANPDISFEKASKLNLGIQGALLKDQLSFSAEYFNNKHYDLLMVRGNSTSILGNIYPTENIGKNRYSGVEYELTWQQSLKSFNYFISANANTVKSKALYMDEVYRPYSWMQRTGQPVNQTFGLTAEGLFQSQQEINNSATILGYSPKPGDIKYLDRNGDKVIDLLDMSPIGSTKPVFYYGINLGFSVKGFDMSTLIQGVENRNMFVAGTAEWEFQNNGLGQAYQHHLDRWTPTNTDATYPRLTAGYNSNNHVQSSYWLHSGDYMRIKNVEIGYSLPISLISRVRVQSLRVFVNSLNLFTKAEFNRVDPEVNMGAYPIQKLINAGVNIRL